MKKMLFVATALSITSSVAFADSSHVKGCESVDLNNLKDTLVKSMEECPIGTNEFDCLNTHIKTGKERRCLRQILRLVYQQIKKKENPVKVELEIYTLYKDIKELSNLP